MWAYVKRTFRRAATMQDEFLGDEAKGIHGVPQRLSDVEQSLAELVIAQLRLEVRLEKLAEEQGRHSRWHGAPGSAPADARRRRDPNGERPQRKDGHDDG
jgi:hypothetical protein